MRKILNISILATSAFLFHTTFYKSAREKLIEKGGQSEIAKSLITSGYFLSILLLIKWAKSTNSTILKLSTLAIVLSTLKYVFTILSTIRDIDGEVQFKHIDKYDKFDSHILFKEYINEYNLKGQYSTFEKALRGLNLSKIEKKIIWTAKTGRGEYLLKPLIKLFSLTKDWNSKSIPEFNKYLNTYFTLPGNKLINIKSDNISKSNNYKNTSIADKKLNSILEKARLK